MLVTQPSSIPGSPQTLSPNPNAQHTTTFNLQTITSNSDIATSLDRENITSDPNWQGSRASVRERNALMFNNDLMADIKFIVGSEGI